MNIRKTELIVVLVCIFVCISCVYAMAFKSREHAKQIVCAGHVHMNSQAAIGYAGDHDGEVTIIGSGWWPHDLTFSATDVLMQYGATRQGFYCPSNKVANPYDVRFWQFALMTMYAPITSDCYSDYDEDLLSPAAKQSYYRVLSYYFLLDSPSGKGTFGGTPPRSWVRDLDDITNPQEYEMITDQTMSKTSMTGFYNITSGGLYNLSAGQIVDQSNHLKQSGLPLGGNVGFVDGHVAWRPFEQMQIRLSTGLYHWW